MRRERGQRDVEIEVDITYIDQIKTLLISTTTVVIGVKRLLLVKCLGKVVVFTTGGDIAALD